MGAKYATEAILITVIAAGSGNLWVILPISCAIVVLLSIVAISYRQTIPAYPNGGGSYRVAKDNLGTLPGLIAAASLLIDYVLTASVFISLVGGSKVIKTPIAAFSPTRQPSVVQLVLALYSRVLSVQSA
jgi:amino acid transporter